METLGFIQKKRLNQKSRQKRDEMTTTIVTERGRNIAYTIYRAGNPITHRLDMKDVDAWIDCQTCDLSIGAVSNGNNPISDEEFIKIVRNLGWIFIPTKITECPDCKKKRLSHFNKHIGSKEK
jgi:hypothetical protein